MIKVNENDLKLGCWFRFRTLKDTSMNFIKYLFQNLALVETTEVLKKKKFNKLMNKNCEG
jgi:hypothetical protein